jgi:hypothetical protein
VNHDERRDIRILDELLGISLERALSAENFRAGGNLFRKWGLRPYIERFV